MTSRQIRSIALAGLLAGCATGSEYRKPDLSMPRSFRNVPVSGPVTSASWWTKFDDPLLNHLVERGLADNLDIEVAMARVDRARAAVGVARAAQSPSGTVEGSATRTRQSLEAGLGQLSQYVPDIERTQDAYALTGGASWELDLAGGLRRGRESAIAELMAAVADGQAARLTVAAEIADAYLQLRGLQERRAIAIDQVTAAEKLESLVRIRFEREAASRRELDQSTASVLAVRAQVPIIDAGIEGQLNRLAVLVRDMPEADRHGLDRPAPLPAATLTSIGTPSDMLRRRPDLVAAERRLAASHARIGAALAEYYPSFSLSGLAGFQSNDLGQMLKDRSSIVQGGLGLQWRLFDFRRIDAEVADARGAEREALATFRAAVLRAAEDVERAVVSEQSADRRAAIHAAELDTARRARRLALQAFEAGQVALIEVVEADRRSLQAADSLAIARLDAARAVIATYRAIGAS